LNLIDDVNCFLSLFIIIGLIILFILLLLFYYLDENREVQSCPVSSVCVYKSRAEINRVLKVKLNSGITNVVLYRFSNEGIFKFGCFDVLMF